ncbi:hypothetical protein FQR65_LT01867 [Abscondita terminalis]|nr:hypothetical protein FQR65_LT01867 [Abscondita terminalis]
MQVTRKKIFIKPKVKEIKVFPINGRSEKASLTSAFSNLRAYFLQYCKVSTIHGLKYVGEPGRYLIEKVIWMGIVVMVCIFCSYLISITYEKWGNSPVMVSFDISDASIDSMPFPAVTICPAPKFIRNGFNLSDVFLRKLFKLNVTKKEESMFDIYSLICTSAQLLAKRFNISSTTQFLREEDVNQFFENCPEWKTFDNRMYWIGEKLKWPLKKIFTKNGVCYTFNMLSFDDILNNASFIKKPLFEFKTRNFNMRYGYTSTKVESDDYPKRTFLSGPQGGFLMDTLVTNTSQVDLLCEEGLAVFRIALHSPYELPNMNKHFLVPLDQALYVTVTPKAITYSDTLKSYPPSIRSCYLYNEKTLLLYSVYTQENCLNECSINATLTSCGCVPFYVPRINGTKICGPGSLPCIQNSSGSIVLITYLKVESCGCLPLCQTMWYNVETTESEWNSIELNKALIKYKPSWAEVIKGLHHFSKLHVFFKDMQFLPARRQEFHDIVDFVSKVGGLLGLCIGLSVVSVIEIFYFCTLRIICNIRRYGKKLWLGTITEQ